MINSRGSAAVALLQDGRVLAAGGMYGSPINQAEKLQVGRRQTALVPLGNGQFLIAGGITSSSSPSLSSAEIYTECTVTTACAAVGANCNWIPDNCGGSLYCGSCAAGQVCSANTCL